MAYSPISNLPTPPSRQDPANFSGDADSFLGALPTFQTEVNAAGDYVDSKVAEVDADAAAAAASVVAAQAAADSSVAAANATAWVSGASYTGGDAVWSLVNYQTYRAITDHSGETGDPSADATNWAVLGSPAEFVQDPNGVITVSGSNVGIGTSSPNGNLDISAGSTPQVILNNTDGTSNNSHDFRIATFGGLTPFWSSLSLDASSIQIKTFTTPRMTIDSSGNLMLGTTILGGTGGLTVSPNTTNGATAVVFNRNPAAGALSHVFDFRDGGASKGSIFYNSTSTLYNTSSDYRLKENITSIEGATDIVKAMNPCTYNFKGYSADWHDGFLAHELQELHPRAVVGEKDEMYDEEYEVTPAVYEDAVIPAVLDEEGNELEAERIERQVVAEAVIGTRSVPKYQSVDYAKLTPILTAALKEALTKIDDLETRLSAMEAAS
jgi:hypothetical protein